MNLRNNFALLFVLLSCFLTYTNAQFRIINGRNIPIESSPHSVAIFHNNDYICVGSIVNMKSVVTAAHCVINLEREYLVIVAGLTDIRQRNTERAQRRYVEYVHRDCDYDRQTKFMDVAVVKVDRSFDENNAVKSILLCNDRLVPGTVMQVSGWGSKTQATKVSSHILQTKYLDVVGTQACKASYADLEDPIYLAETIICAGRGGEDVCFGDSGAGGVLNRRLCAVVHGGCGDRDLPDVYTDVTNTRVRNFITLRMRN